jgi:hypothetical protein
MGSVYFKGPRPRFQNKMKVCDNLVLCFCVNRIVTMIKIVIIVIIVNCNNYVSDINEIYHNKNNINDNND